MGIPQELGEGVSLPGPEVLIAVAGAPQALPATDAEGEFAFYPEVADDTDLVVSPSPEGIELLTDVRSPEAPRQTTYRLSVPAGAELKATRGGGAEVAEGESTSIVIPPPTAIDAAGDQVPTEMQVEGSSLTVSIDPGPSAAYPILVDPNFVMEAWHWTAGGTGFAGWTAYTTNAAAMNAVPYTRWTEPTLYPGLDATSGYGGNAVSGTNAGWQYLVPRYSSDVSKFGSPPSTWVQFMWIEGLAFLPWGKTANYPALVAGLSAPPPGGSPAQAASSTTGAKAKSTPRATSTGSATAKKNPAAPRPATGASRERG